MPSRRAFLNLFLVLLAVVACVPVALANGLAKRAEPRFDGFIVQFKADSAPRKDPAARQRALDGPGRALGLSINPVRRLGIGADLVRTHRKLGFAEAEALMNRLRRDPDVEFVELDRRLTRTFTPNDPLYGAPNNYQWHYFEATGGINAPAAWDLASGSGVVVAVLDTGITNHSDLNANVVSGYDFIEDIATAGDGNGRDSDPSDPGDWVVLNQCEDDPKAHPSSWHGTHVAGTIAAVTNNSKGVAGVAFNAKVMPLRVLGHCGGLSSDIADALVWAVGGTVTGVPTNANPVEVINMSLGGPNNCGAATQAAINYAVNAGAVVVVSAGNDDADALAYEPANCANVITVGATGRDGAKSFFSNYGSALDVSAPGGDADNDIASTWNSGTQGPSTENYGLSSGTSMSAPHVAGVAALMQGVSPSTPAVVESVLENTARALPVACPQGCGAGIINAQAAVSSVGAGALVISDVTATEGNVGSRIFTFTVSLSKPAAGTVTFDVSTASGSATSGSDFNALNLVGQTIVAGATSKSFSVLVNGDAVVEGNETFFVNVGNVSGIAVAKSQGAGVILNDDAIALAAGVTVGPIAGALGSMTYYSLEVPAGRTSMTISTTGGTGDADLYVRQGSLPSTTVSTKASEGDSTVETVTLDNPQAGTWYVLVYGYSAYSGVSIKGDYLPGTTPMLSVGDVVVTEGNAGTTLANFTVSLSPTSASPVTFDMATDDGSAAAGSDYVGKTQAMNIPAGQSSATFSVSVNGDTEVERNESFAAELRNVVGAQLGRTRGMARINNDDLASLSIGDVSIAEGNSGITTATFTLRLDKPMPSPVTYSIATSNGSATAGSDYVARSVTGRFIDAGRTTQVFEVQVNGDAAVESGETFNVTISGVTGALVADATAVGTITNDDSAAAPVVSASRTTVVLGTATDSLDDLSPECRSAQAMAEARRGGKSVRHCQRELEKQRSSIRR